MSTTGSSTRRRRGASSTGSTATRSRRCSGRRSCRGSRPAASSRSRRASSSSASASGWRSAPPQWWDLRRDVRPGGLRGAARLGRRASASRPAATSVPTGSSRGDARQLDEETARGLAERARRRLVPGRAGRAEAVRPPPEPAVHDLDAAAGGEPQAPLHGADDDAPRAAPLRERLHHVHAHRLDDAVGVGAHRRARAGRRALRRRLRPRAAAPLRAEGEERAGGARGDPARGRPLPHAAGRALGALRGRARALRADLDADDRVADEGRAGPDRLAADRGRLERAAKPSSSAPRAP